MLELPIKSKELSAYSTEESKASKASISASAHA